MLRAKSLRMLLGIGFVLLAVSCTPNSNTPMPEASTQPLLSPTSTVPTAQITPTVQTPAGLMISQPPGENNGEVVGLAFQPDGKVLASLYRNGKIILWDVDTYQIIQSLPGGGEIGGLGIMPGFAFSPDGKFLVSISNGGTPILWTVATGQSIEVESNLSRGNGMALSPDGTMLAYGKCAEVSINSICTQYMVILWDVATRQPVGQSLTFNVGASAPLGLLFSPDGKTLAAINSGTTGSGKIELFDVVTRQSIASPLGGEEQFSGMAFTPDGKFMALGSIGGVIYIWDVKSHEVVSRLISEHGLVTGMTFSPNGKMLATRIFVPSTENILHEEIVLWDMNSFQMIGQPLTGQAVTGNDVGLISTAFNPDSTTLAFGTDDGVIILWKLATKDSQVP